jgi:glutathione S-transferase
MRVICEFQTYAEPSLARIVNAHLQPIEVAEAFDELTDAMHVVAREARTIEGRLSKELWIVGANYSAADMVIFPWIQLLRRALNEAAAAELGARFLPMETNYPRPGALDRTHRGAAGLRAHLPAALARDLRARFGILACRPVGWPTWLPRGALARQQRGNEKWDES